MLEKNTTMDNKRGLTKWEKVRYTHVFASIFYNNSFRKAESGSESSRCKRAFVTIYQICTSHFGLVILLIIYSFIGAAIFQAVEGKQRGLSDSEKLSLARSEAIRAVLNAINVSGDSQVEGALEEVFADYESNLTAEYILYVYPRAEEVWDFWGSMLYCATVYTTIGYGRMFPVTTGGKWLTIVYSLIGIPLCLIAIANLGILFTTLQTMVYQTIVKRCCRSSSCCIKKSSPQASPPTNMASHPENRSHDSRIKIEGDTEAVEVPVADSEVKHQKDVSGKHHKQNVEDVEKGKPSKTVIGAARKFKTGSARSRAHDDDDAIKTRDQGEGQQEEEEEEKKCHCCGGTDLSVLVPIFITVIYMLFGVLMYSRWEDWNFTDAFYFLFISLSTIGFGDIVPEHRNFFLASGIYILLGLSLVAMTVSTLMKVTSSTLEMAKEKVNMLAEKGLGVEIPDTGNGSSHKVSD